MAAYTNEEYYDMLMALGECHGQYHVAARRYAELYPNRARHPSAPVILRAAQRLHETGSVLPDKHDTGRNRNARNLRNTERIVRAFEDNAETSIRVVAREHNFSYSTVQRTLKEEKLHAFHYTRVQHLRAEDYQARRTFCENFLRQVDRDPRFSSRVIFSDESLFTQEGIFNSHNMHYWSEENPRVTRLKNFQVRWKINIWAGIMGTQILGPVILPDILTGQTYVEFLRENMPEFSGKILFLSSSGTSSKNPLDFFLWGYCKEIIYKTLPEDVEDLETRLRHAIWNIEEDVMENVQLNLMKRMRACIRMDGAHFEHLL